MEERARGGVEEVDGTGIGRDRVVERRADDDRRVARRHGGAEEVALARMRGLEGVAERARGGVEDVGRAGVRLRRVVERRADDDDPAGRGDGVAEEVVVLGRRVGKRVREDAGRRVEEIGRTGPGRAATVEGRANDHGIPRGREREAEEVVEGRSGLGENADVAAAATAVRAS